MVYTVKQLTEKYKVSIPTVLHWISSGELIALNCGVTQGKKKPRWRITEEALTKFEISRSTSPQPKKQSRKRDNNITEYYK